MKNSMHISDKGSAYANGSRKTPQPPTAKMTGITSRPGGNIKPGTSANASMRVRPSKK